jgi:hypothetical protein
MNARIGSPDAIRLLRNLSKDITLQIDDTISEKADDAQLVSLLSDTDRACRKTPKAKQSHIISALLHGIATLHIKLNMSDSVEHIQNNIVRLNELLGDEFSFSIDRMDSRLMLRQKSRLIFALRKRPMSGFVVAFPYLFN